MSTVLVVGAAHSGIRHAIKARLNSIDYNVVFPDENNVNYNIPFCGHPIGNVQCNFLGEIENRSKYPSLPEKQTYTPKITRKTKRW